MRNLNFLIVIIFCLILSCDRIASSAASVPSGAVIVAGTPVHIRIYKQENVLEIWQSVGGDYELVKTYEICNWSGTLGPKLKQGDRQSPEGFYRITKSSLNPNSLYHLSFNLGYPNAYDRAHGRTGNYLMVHGDCVSIGCYAMTDAGIEEIYGVVEAAFEAGQQAIQVHIFPFRMTEENLAMHDSSVWASFWQDLAEEEALFQSTRQPVNVSIRAGEYVFQQP